MLYTIFLIAAYFMGFIAAIPAGPVQIEVVRRAINGYLKSALMVIVGAFTVDLFYGCIAFFGIAPFLEEKKVMAIFWLAGGLILIAMGILVIRHSRQLDVDYNPQHLKKKRWALLSGISLSAVNPMMILWWLSAARIFEDVGLIRKLTPETALTLLIAGSMGLASYLTALALFLHWVKKFISLPRLRHINLAFGILLLLLALYFIFTSFRTLFFPG
jgi:threonine/homoserine/homoserine lactone efflux protein